MFGPREQDEGYIDWAKFQFAELTMGAFREAVQESKYGGDWAIRKEAQDDPMTTLDEEQFHDVFSEFSNKMSIGELELWFNETYNHSEIYRFLNEDWINAINLVEEAYDYDLSWMRLNQDCL